MSTDTYLLGSEPEELRRLEQQAATLAPATRAILRLAGIEPGMRVLDLGTGAGDVAFEVAKLVGPSGSVIGIDQSTKALTWAAQRTTALGYTNISFIHDDVHHVRLTDPVDAVVGRLVLLYTPDPAAVLRKFAELLRPGGVVVAMEYDMAVVSLLPGTEFVEQVNYWITEAFKRSGLDPSLGVRLGEVLSSAGLTPEAVLGLQAYVEPGDPTGGHVAAGVLRTLLPVLARTGIATDEEIGVDTLAARLSEHQVGNHGVLRLPTLVGAWARRA